MQSCGAETARRGWLCEFRAPPSDRAAPLGVRATLASAHRARDEGDAAAIADLRPEVTRLFGTADAAEGLQSFGERRAATFTGR